MNHSFFHHTDTNLDTSCIFSQTEPRRRVDAWPPCWSVGAISLSHEHNDASHSSGTAAKFSTIALPTFALTTELHRCYSCDISVSVFSRAQQRSMPCDSFERATLRLLFCDLTD